ncbi:A/G-specific adenine glycosylase [Parabacteroides sp. PF5-9]|uniref:A/G-specific adenine glycosylase n=1 Tax=Parabacteroides sp. PF5-9 TaxID=1742404 RepID=UPI0024740F64|nr:A/G-specific adenine glycosylase [Parabacteroides sp. PF5-9]
MKKAPVNEAGFISKMLIIWYDKHKRDLPWRKSTDPYIIWVSEIILQQTRVDQGKDYFERFTGRFPDISSLANASEDDVLKYWQGLGYYSRARNMHTAAKMIVEKYDGIFPADYKTILSLRGIGEYTAAAIASFVWNQPCPVVDGNVFRVLARLFAIDTPVDTTAGKKIFFDLAGSILDPQYAGVHNQAIMEFGALQCVPRNPECLICPLMNICIAYASGEVQNYPVKRHKTKTRNRYFHYFYIVYNGYTWLHRREGKDIWNGLYEFPLIETESPMDFSQLQQTAAFQELFRQAGRLTISTSNLPIKHVLSHQVLYARFYRVELNGQLDSLDNYLRVLQQDIDQYAIPRLIHIYLENLDRKLPD